VIGSIQNTKGDYFIMPKVTYTAAKGLVQSTGSGFDVTGTVTVSGTMTGARAIVKATTVALTLADSGCVLIPTAAALQTFTLPAVATAAGFQVTFQAGSAYAHVISGGTSLIQGAVFHNTNGATLARQQVTNRSSIALNATNPLIGDYLTITGDGTNYYVFGWCNAAVVLA
jgi:hypothetical protein